MRLDRGRLAAARAREQAVQAGILQELQERLGRAAHGGAAHHAGELLHGGIPGNDSQAGVGDEHRVVETVDEALAESVHEFDEYNNCEGVLYSGIAIA